MDHIASGHGHLHDPHRRWLRHTYQEGPGFLFLATRGGRLPHSAPAASAAATVRARAHLLRVAREHSISAALALGQCSRASLFRWQSAFIQGGLRDLVPAPRGPRLARARYPAGTGRYHGSSADLLELQAYLGGTSPAPNRHRQRRLSGGALRPARDGTAIAPPGPGPRYERAHPNELWHIDIKGPSSSSSPPAAT
jgi:hypothetical protein